MHIHNKRFFLLCPAVSAHHTLRCGSTIPIGDLAKIDLLKLSASGWLSCFFYRTIKFHPLIPCVRCIVSLTQPSTTDQPHCSIEYKKANIKDEK
ncbi:hypothetical protein CLOSTMETH_03123 [[Clostridium] methylpentosum DSM 5476]|uniref:Uncharacterized protein n=1 Tax=[Clostridium] methylpentosum DSM 5476 TaxID=537013 RepID=C0EGX9_9FIRM|nr:hypothetical protein CLOSTMETH_03123 [[Clostridium] methylpentosum DSM 5476]